MILTLFLPCAKPATPGPCGNRPTLVPEGVLSTSPEKHSGTGPETGPSAGTQKVYPADGGFCSLLTPKPGGVFSRQLSHLR